MQTLTAEKFETLTAVRVFSPAGPCLMRFRLVRRNRSTATVAFINGSEISSERVHLSFVHEAPCPSCGDHAQTQYPNGYED